MKTLIIYAIRIAMILAGLQLILIKHHGFTYLILGIFFIIVALIKPKNIIFWVRVCAYTSAAFQVFCLMAAGFLFCFFFFISPIYFISIKTGDTHMFRALTSLLGIIILLVYSKRLIRIYSEKLLEKHILKNTDYYREMDTSGWIDPDLVADILRADNNKDPEEISKVSIWNIIRIPLVIAGLIACIIGFLHV